MKGKQMNEVLSAQALRGMGYPTELNIIVLPDSGGMFLLDSAKQSIGESHDKPR
jgi:hypothetical protein